MCFKKYVPIKATKFCFKILKERDHVEDLDLDESVIGNKLYLKDRILGEYGLDSLGLLLESVASPC